MCATGARETVTHQGFQAMKTLLVRCIAMPGSAAIGRSGDAAETDPLSQPFGRPGFVNVAGSDREHGRLGLVNVGRIRIPPSLVEIDEQHQRRPRGSLVAVDECCLPGMGVDRTAMCSIREHLSSRPRIARPRWHTSCLKRRLRASRLFRAPLSLAAGCAVRRPLP